MPLPVTCQVYLSIYPLGENEPARALAAIQEVWVPPSSVSRRTHQGALLLEVAMEAPLPEGESPTLFAQKLSIAIWRRLGRYTKVVVEAEYNGLERRCELEQRDYQLLLKS